MAISLKAAGTWAEYTADGTVAIPGTPAAGDRMFLFAAWKPYSSTATVSGWTAIGSEYADGVVGNGNGVGSVKVQAWYRDWQTGDSAPTLDLDSWPANSIAGAVIQLWTKGATEAWQTPTTVNAPFTDSANPWSATSTATITIPDASVVMELVGVRDDSSTMTRSATTALSDDGSPTVTWNGNYVESPATHLSTTTGFDLAADLGHRFVTTGASGVNLTATATLSSTETGSIKWVVQYVQTATNAPAGNAAGTGAAYATAMQYAPGGQATGTGTAYSISMQYAAAGNAAGTGTAPIAATKVEPVSGLASSAGSAHDPTVSAVDGGGITWGDWSATYSNPVVTETNVDAGLAAGTGASQAPTAAVSPAAELSSGTGAALAPTAVISPAAGLAAGTGTSHDAGKTLAVPAGHAAGTGAAHDTTISTSTTTYAPAGLASGGAAGPAFDLAAFQANAFDDQATIDPHISISFPAGHAAGTGTAANATTGAGKFVDAGLAAGTGAANQPTITAVGITNASAGLATGTGASYDTTVTTSSATNAAAGLAAGTGAAADAGKTISFAAGHAAGTGAAYDVPMRYVAAEVAAGTGTAQNATVTTSSATNVAAGHAAGTGAAGEAGKTVKPNAPVSAGTGAAQNATITASGVTNAAAENAAGTGTSYDTGKTVRFSAGIASGTGAANNPTVNTAAFTNVNAGHASGTGSVGSVAAFVKFGAAVAAGTGTTGSTSSVAGNPGVAAGTGTAWDTKALVKPNAGATGTGTAYDATIYLVVVGQAFAQVATGTGAAYNTAMQYAPAGNAAGTGTAHDTPYTSGPPPGLGAAAGHRPGGHGSGPRPRGHATNPKPGG